MVLSQVLRELEMPGLYPTWARRRDLAAIWVHLNIRVWRSSFEPTMRITVATTSLGLMALCSAFSLHFLTNLVKYKLSSFLTYGCGNELRKTNFSFLHALAAAKWQGQGSNSHLCDSRTQRSVTRKLMKLQRQGPHFHGSLTRHWSYVL